MGEWLLRDDVDPPGFYYFDDDGEWYDEDGQSVEFMDEDDEHDWGLTVLRSYGQPIDSKYEATLRQTARDLGVSIADAHERLSGLRGDGKVPGGVDGSPIEDPEKRRRDMATVMEQDADLRREYEEEQTVGYHSQAPYEEEGLTPTSLREDD